MCTAQISFTALANSSACTTAYPSSQLWSFAVASASAPGRKSVSRQRLRERDESLHRLRPPLRDGLGRQRVERLPHVVADVRVRLELASVEEDTTPADRKLVDLAGHVLDDVPGRRPVEVREDAVDRVQAVVAGDAARQRAADHPPEKLRDVRLVLRRPETHEHLGARAVPPGRDRLLRDEHPHFGLLLNPLRLDPVDLPPAERLGLVAAENVTNRVAREIREHAVDRVERGADLVGVRRVRDLEDEQRHDGLGAPLLRGVPLPAERRLFSRFAASATSVVPKSPASPGMSRTTVSLTRPDSCTRDGSTTTSGRARLLPRVSAACHRLLEPLDRRRDADHDRHREPHVVAFDELTDDRRPVASSRRVLNPRCASSRTK